MFFQKLYGAQPNGAFMFLAFLSLDRLIDRIEETPFPLQNGNNKSTGPGEKTSLRTLEV